MADFPKFDLLSTPNPEEFVVAVTCEVDNIRLAQMPVSGVTTYEDFEAGDRSRVDEFGAYIFTMASKPGAGLLTFYFAKPKTDDEKYTPWLTLPKTNQYFWPSVLENWRAAPDVTRTIEQRDPGGNAIFTMRWNARFTLRPYVQGSTQFERLEYLAPTQFELQKPVILQPVHFEWGLPGDAQDLGRVLIARRIRKPVTVLGPTVTTSQVFEPTTPSGWARHLASTDQEQLASGIWSMWEEYAIAPIQNNTIRDK